MIKLIYKLLSIIILSASLVLGWYGWSYYSFMNTPMALEKNGMLYQITPGMTLIRVVNDLKEKAVLTDTRYLLWHARLTGQADKIHIGEYDIKPGTTPKEFYTILIEGKVFARSLTIIEGWTFKQMMEAVNNNKYLQHNLQGLDAKSIMKKLQLEGIHAEGRFLPDTYHFTRATSDIDFLKRVYGEMETYLAHEWQQRDTGLPFRDAYDALILASIVEKETGSVSERKMIAGIFIRRLEKNMRLQSDPTVIYGMGESYKGNIRRVDLKRNTPYNSYRNRGLPPTPIALPGRDAIHSTLHPDKGDSLYFVARGDGRHYFSATLQEHNNAVIKYQLKGRKRSFSSYKHNN